MSLKADHPYRQLFIVAAFLGLLFAAFELSGLRSNFSLAFLQEQILANRLTGLLIFVALFSLGNLIQLPGWIFFLAANLTLGNVWGGLVTYVGACIACIATFLVIRLIGGEALRELKSPLARRILGRLDQHPVRSVVLLRILFQTLPPMNCALALAGIRARDYIAGTLLGLPLPILVYCLAFETVLGFLAPELLSSLPLAR